MPRDRYNLQISQVHVADGFSTDCDEMVQRCLQLSNLDFQQFTKIWKDMNFDLLYEGRTSGAEIAELSEELIYIAKHYMVKDTSYFEESITGLFLVYSLLNLQPFSNFACLKLVPNDVRAVNRIETVARRERRLDVLYILGEVLIKWTQYHAEERPRGMEGVIRKYLEGYTSIDKLGVRPMGVFYRQNEELDHIRDLGSLTRQYMLAKNSLFEDGTKDPSLQYINGDLATELNTSLRKLVSGVLEDSDEQENESSSEEEEKMAEHRSQTVQAIKAKAMSNTVDPMQHLITADNRKNTKSSPKSKSDLKIPTGKIKTGTHTKPVTTSPKKQKTQMKAKRKLKQKDNSSDATGAELQIDEFHQIRDEEDNDKDKTQENDEEENPDYRGVDINVESLPLLLRNGDFGPDIEVEFIDQTKEKKETKRNKTKHRTIRKPKPPEETNSFSSDDDEPLSLKAGPNFLRTYKRERKVEAEVIDGFPLKKKEKRDMVRRELKTKFNRLGMLPVANFEDKNNL